MKTLPPPPEGYERLLCRHCYRSLMRRIGEPRRCPCRHEETIEEPA